MSTTNPRTSYSGPTVSDGRTRQADRRPRTSSDRETKPAIMTSELWLTLAGVVLLVVTYLAADDSSLNLFRTCLLATILGAAYIVSRGLAKSGSHDRHSDIDAAT